MLKQRFCNRSWTIRCILVHCLLLSFGKLTLGAESPPVVTIGPLTNGIPGRESQSGRVSLSTPDHVICTGHWTEENAKVYCSENGFSYGIALFYTVKSESGEGTPAENSKRSISCTGKESTLSECSLREASLCGAEYVGGVLCYHSRQFSPTVRLGGALLNDKTPSMHGLVGLSLDGQIGSISSEGWTDRNESRVLCMMFNYTRGRLMPSAADRAPGVGAIMTGVKCNGNEDSIFKCKIDRWQRKSGDHTKDVHINCSYADNCPTPTAIEHAELHLNPDQVFPDGDVITYQCATGYVVSDDSDSSMGTFTCRDGVWEGKNITCRTVPDGVVSLGGGLPSAIDRTGRVLVVENLVNKSICPEDWDANAAQVVCREKGFPYGYPVSILNDGTPYLDKTYACIGTETSLKTCQKIQNNCNDGSKAVGGVICYKSVAYPPEVSMKPPNASIVDGGLVVIMTSDQQMGICNKSWTNREAKVVCVERGFRNGSIDGYKVMGVGSYVYDSFKCTGNEKKLLECEMGGWIPASECGGRTHYAHVKCRNKEPLKDYEIRLTDGIPGQMNYTGRILTAQKNVIKSICPEMLTEAVANVSCHQLGLEGGIPIRYENQTAPSFYGHVTCIGTEASLDKCTYNVSKQTCTDAGDISEAGILCYKRQYFKPSVDLNPVPKSVFTDRGQVTLSVNGITGTVCRDKWTEKDSNVFCRQLNKGFDRGEIQDFGMQGINYALKGVSCNGGETSLFQCYINGWEALDKKTQSCPTAQVKCLKPETTTPQPTTDQTTETLKPTTTTATSTTTTTTATPTTTATITPENDTTADNDTWGNETDTTDIPTDTTDISNTTECANETDINGTSSCNSTDSGFGSEEEDDDGSSLAVPISITCVVVVLLVIAGAFIYRRRKQHQQLMGYVRYNNEDITPSVVPQRETDTVMIRDPARGEMDMKL